MCLITAASGLHCSCPIPCRLQDCDLLLSTEKLSPRSEVFPSPFRVLVAGAGVSGEVSSPSSVSPLVPHLVIAAQFLKLVLNLVSTRAGVINSKID